jgi:hypothetical protein
MALDLFAEANEAPGEQEKATDEGDKEDIHQHLAPHGVGVHRVGFGMNGRAISRQVASHSGKRVTKPACSSQ